MLSKMHSGLLFLKDFLIVGGIILAHAASGTKVEKIDINSQDKTLATAVKTLAAAEFTDFKGETNTKPDKLLIQRLFLWQ